MPVYQDKTTKTWFVKLYYTDYTGTRQQKFKRGFQLQRPGTAAGPAKHDLSDLV